MVVTDSGEVSSMFWESARRRCAMAALTALACHCGGGGLVIPMEASPDRTHRPVEVPLEGPDDVRAGAFARIEACAACADLATSEGWCDERDGEAE